MGFVLSFHTDNGNTAGLGHPNTVFSFVFLVQSVNQTWKPSYKSIHLLFAWLHVQAFFRMNPVHCNSLLLPVRPFPLHFPPQESSCLSSARSTVLCSGKASSGLLCPIHQTHSGSIQLKHLMGFYEKKPQSDCFSSSIGVCQYR